MKSYLYETHARKTRQHPPIRLKNVDRTYIPQLLAQFNFTKGAEIGVAGGRYSEILCKTIPNIDLLCVDTWAVGDDAMSKSKGQEVADARYVEAQERTKGYNVTFLKGKSMDIVRDIPYESLDFVYIDACHDFDYVMQDIIEWSKRVKKGGLVAGHDYYRFNSAGVIEAVDAYIKCHQIREVFLTNEMEASWFFCK